MSRFEDNLWGSVIDRHGEDLAAAGVAVRTRARRNRPRLAVGGTLGLAGVGAALVLALGAGGAAAPPAFAITKHSDGSVLVTLTNVEAVPAAERQLAEMGIHAWFEPAIGPGAAPVNGPVTCTPAPSPTSATGRGLANATPSDAKSATGGPPVKVLLGADGTSTVPSGEPGAGPWHLGACYLYTGTFPGTGNTGNTGAG